MARRVSGQDPGRKKTAQGNTGQRQPAVPAKAGGPKAKAATPKAVATATRKTMAGTTMPGKTMPGKTAPAARKQAPATIAATKAAARQTEPTRATAQRAARLAGKAAPKQGGGAKAFPKKAASPAIAKPAAARVPAMRRPPVRRVRAAAAMPRPTLSHKAAATPRKAAPGKRAAPRLKTPGTPQSFAVNHLNEADFKQDGLRAYALYRDLGMSAPTGGLCQAHVIRLLSPCTDEVRKRHLHEPELQLIYVLRGWIKNEFEGHGVQMMSAGSCWLQPPGIPHTVLDYSADVEMLEIIVPADFRTTDLG